MDEIIFLYTTWPDAETADAAAAQAIDRRLAACANVLAPMRSVYRWKGTVERASEIPAIFKTTARAAPALAELLKQLHPYDTPAIAALPVAEQGSHAPFLAWIGAETGRD